MGREGLPSTVETVDRRSIGCLWFKPGQLEEGGSSVMMRADLLSEWGGLVRSTRCGEHSVELCRV